MNSAAAIQLFTTLVVVAGLSQGNDLGTLVEGVKPLEVIKLNGTVLKPDSELVSVDRDEDGTLSVSYTGAATLSVSRSTGLSSGTAQQLMRISQNALGSRYQLIASIKRGGRLLTNSNVKKLDEIIEGNKQKTTVYIGGAVVDMDKAAVIDSSTDFTVLEPEGRPGFRIVVSNSATAITTTSADDQIKISFTKGLNDRQIETLKENFYGNVAQHVSKITGFPKSLIELAIEGRDAIVGKLSRILSPTEQVAVGPVQVDLDVAKRKPTSVGMVLQPSNLPKVKITWRKDEKLRVESEDGERISAVYSKGVDPQTIGSIVSGLHRALTLRFGMLSWSNRYAGSIPPQLESTLQELKTRVQKRTILVNGKEVDLKKASVIETSEDSVLYRLQNGVQLRMFFSGGVSAQGAPLTLEFTPGIAETQITYLFTKINQLFSTSIGFSKDSGEAMLGFETNRPLLHSLMRGIKPKEKIKVDDETLTFSNATVSKKDRDYTEYTVDSFDDVIMTKFTEGDIQVNGKGRKIFISRSTGLPVQFLNRLVAAVNNVMPKKRWFFNFGEKGGKNHRDQELQSVIDEIPNMVQQQTVTVDGKEVDFSKATILSVDDLSTVYTPETNSKVRITRFVSGDIEASVEDDDDISVKVSQGITSQDADTLMSNLQKIVGDRFKIGPKPPGNFWCSSGDMRKLLGWLLNTISPKVDVSWNGRNDARKRDFSNGNRRSDLTVADYNGRGVNVTLKNAGQLDVFLSTGLTQDNANKLVRYLVPLLESREDVIRMITGSISAVKIKTIKDLLKNMIQEKVVTIDSEVLASDRNSRRFSSGTKDVLLKDDSDGGVQIDIHEKHIVNIALGPGLTTKQAEQMYRNIKMAFREKFAKITNLPIQFLGFLSNFKKFFMKSYFYSAAPPKEFISVNGEEIRSSTLGHHHGNDTTVSSEDDFERTGVRVVKRPDGTLELTSSEGGNIDVIKTTSLDEDQIDRILKAVEYRLGLKNKMFRISTDELFSPPDKYERIETLLGNLVSTARLYVDGKAVDLNNPRRTRSVGDCSLNWFGSSDYLVVKRCLGGQFSIDSRRGGEVSLHLSPGISQQQSNYILRSLMTTIGTKSSNVKHLANYPDTFLQLLADGRIKSLEKFLVVLLPREDIFVDGNRVNMEPFNTSLDQTYQTTEFETHPGLEMSRYDNGSIQVKSWTGGHLDLHINSGLSVDLARLIVEKFKHNAAENLAPYLMVMDEMLSGNGSTLLGLIDHIIKFRKSSIPIDLLVTLAQRELKIRLHRINIDEDLIHRIAEKAVQSQLVFINDQQIDLEKCTVVATGNDYITYSPNNKDYIKITQFDNGRLSVDSLREETISVSISAGIPPKMLTSFTETLNRHFNKLDSDKAFVDNLNLKVTGILKTLCDSLTKGIHERRKLYFNDNEIALTEDLLIKDTNTADVYKKDGVLITVDSQGNTQLELSTPGKLEFDVSSGLMSEPVISFLHNNALDLLNEMYQTISHFETVAPVMTKAEKIIGNLLDSLQQKIYINGKALEHPSMQVIESTNEFKVLKDKSMDGVQITVKHDGRIIIDNEDPRGSLLIHINHGLSAGDLNRLSANTDLLFSRTNPIELVADFLDVLPKNFFMLAQNMDRVLSIMNLIKF